MHVNVSTRRVSKRKSRIDGAGSGGFFRTSYCDLSAGTESKKAQRSRHRSGTSCGLENSTQLLPRIGRGPRWMSTMLTNRGDVVLVAFPDSNRKRKTYKRRPALVVQADRLDTGLPGDAGRDDYQQLIACASHPSRWMVGQTSPEGRQMGLRTDSVVMTDNLATVHLSRKLNALSAVVLTYHILTPHYGGRSVSNRRGNPSWRLQLVGRVTVEARISRLPRNLSSEKGAPPIREGPGCASA